MTRGEREQVFVAANEVVCLGRYGEIDVRLILLCTGIIHYVTDAPD